MDDLHSTGYFLAHLFSGGAILGAILGFFPAFAAFFALVFYMIQIWESTTIQNMTNGWRKAWKLRKIARLRGKIKVLTGELGALDVVHAAAAEAKSIVADATAEADKIAKSTPEK